MKPSVLVAGICIGIVITNLRIYGAQEPFFAGLGPYTRKITTNSPEAQRYFRHSLGASLMQAGRWSEVEQVYRDDLSRLPLNGWSLYGLAESLRLQKKNEAEAAATETNFRKVWANADLKITSSCLCQPGS